MSFQQGLSGLGVSTSALDAIGNNVSNASTVGFKVSRGEFADVFAASLTGGGASNIGIGASLASVAQQFTQGNITSTNNALDVAVNGGGFFQMSNSGAISYSRNGQFQVDKSGYVVNAAGYKLQGYEAIYTNDPSGIIVQSTPTEIFIDPTDIQPKSTGTINVGLNLDSRLTTPQVTTFDASNPLSYNSSTSVTIYDSLGNTHVLSMYFIFAGPNAASETLGSTTYADGQLSQWDVRYALDGVSNPTTAGSHVPSTTAKITSGDGMRLQFDTNGKLVGLGTPKSVTGSAAPTTLTIGATNNEFTLSVDGTTSGTVTLTSGTYTAAALAAELQSKINADAALSGASKSVTVTESGGVLKITSNSTGAGAEISGLSSVGTDTTVANLFGASMTSEYSYAAITRISVGFDLDKIVGSDNKATSPMSLTAPTAGIDFSSSTQFGSTFGVNNMVQDGFSSGRLAGIAISPDGVIQGRYSNGQSKKMGQIALAKFNNPNGLQSIGGNQWQETSTSGAPIIGAPGTGANGVIQSAAIEESNVDLTAELVAMITQQRSYQANAQTIKTQDAILQTLVNLR